MGTAILLCRTVEADVDLDQVRAAVADAQQVRRAFSAT